MVHVINPERGWVCSACGRGYAPWARECSFCPGDGQLGKASPASEFGPLSPIAPVIQLPANLTKPGMRWLFRATREWQEIWPGLQGRLGSFGGVNETAEAMIEFRQPPSGEDNAGDV